MPELNWKNLNSAALEALRDLQATSTDAPTWRQVCAYNYLATEAFGQASAYGIPDANLLGALTPTQAQYDALAKVASVANGGALPRNWSTVEATANGYLKSLPSPLTLSEDSSRPANTDYADLSAFIAAFEKTGDYDQVVQEYKSAYNDTTLHDGDYEGPGDPLDPDGDHAGSDSGEDGGEKGGERA